MTRYEEMECPHCGKKAGWDCWSTGPRGRKKEDDHEVVPGATLRDTRSALGEMSDFALDSNRRFDTVFDTCRACGEAVC